MGLKGLNYRKYLVFILIIIISLTLPGGCVFLPEADRVADGMYEVFYELGYQDFFSFYERNFGLAVDDQLLLPDYYRLGDRQGLTRPVMVAVENHPRSRPQAGIEEADFVYEVLSEGGITRFLPVYYKDLPEKVGPIRSVRDYMGVLSAEHGALLLHAGASEGGYARISAADVLNLDEISRSQYYWRSSERRMPHNLYTGNDKVKDYLEGLDWQPDLSAYKFDFTTRTNSLAGDNFIEEINLFYWGNYLVSYEYNQSNNRYDRYINDEPHKVESGQQLTADNIIVLHADTNVIDDVGRLSVDLDSGGKGYLFDNGEKQEIRWSRTNGRITLLDGDDQEVLIKSGITWVQIMPISARVEYN